MKTKKVECSNFACYRGTVEVRGSAKTPEGETLTEVCPICRGDGFIEVPDVDKPATVG
jgi:hypothetical protein